MIDIDKIIVNGRVDTTKLLEACGKPLNEVDPEYLKSGMCATCGKDLSYQIDMTLCKTLNLRKKRQIDDLEFTEADLDQMLSDLDGLDFTVKTMQESSGKTVFENEDSKTFNYDRNLISILIGQFIDNMWRETHEIWTNAFFFEIEENNKVNTGIFDRITPHFTDEGELKKQLDIMPRSRIENRGMYLVRYSEPKALSLYKNAKICDEKNCVTFAEDVLEYGFIDKGDAKVELMLCDSLRIIDNFYFCDSPEAYKCYNEKSNFEGNCEVMSSNYIPNQSYHFAGDQIYFYVNGIQKVHEFYLSQKEREELVAKFHPKEEDDLLAFLKSRTGRLYFFGWHVAMVSIGIISLIRYCVLRFKTWIREEKEKRIKEQEKQNQETSRTQEDKNRMDDLELRLNLLQNDMDGMPKKLHKAKKVEFYNR